MKIIYLDQLHWIEITKAFVGKSVSADIPKVIMHMVNLRRENQAVFPLSAAHYYETLKHSVPDKRSELAVIMQIFSGGKTVAPVDRVVGHEIQLALNHFFPENVMADPFSYVGDGSEHAFGNSFDLGIDWSKIPESLRSEAKSNIDELFEHFLLCGVMRFENDKILVPSNYDTSAGDTFVQHLEGWRGMASRLNQSQLERLIYRKTFDDIAVSVRAELDKQQITVTEFLKFGDTRLCQFLDLMPSRKVDMHLRREWAKNSNLKPKQSDLNDWCFIGCAVCYADIVVTEKQMNNLLSRMSGLKAKVTSSLTDLMTLVPLSGQSSQELDLPLLQALSKAVPN